MCPENQLERWITAGKGLEPETRNVEEAGGRGAHARKPREVKGKEIPGWVLQGLPQAGRGWRWAKGNPPRALVMHGGQRPDGQPRSEWVLGRGEHG